MIEVPLTQGKVALIDNDDAELVGRYKWSVQRAPRTFYAITNIRRPDGGHTTLKMHRLLLGLIDRRVDTDHINGDGLDNRRANLRPSAHTENVRNRKTPNSNTSGFKGVSAHRLGWMARIGVDGKRLHLGYFDTPQEAARAYDVKARELHGEFARLNFA